MTEIDAILQASLQNFLLAVSRTKWYGKEREAISLYVFGYLLGCVKPNSILHDPRQIGIEVRVPKAVNRGKKIEICKDLVIWPEPGMNCWDNHRRAVNDPLTVMEWKVNQAGAEYDIDWLAEFTRGRSKVTGYSVSLDLIKGASMTCSRMQNGIVQRGWFVWTVDLQRGGGPIED